MKQANQHSHVIAVIPARFGSTRFPGKPLEKIAGTSLIQLTYENTKRCPDFDDVWVATDDQRIYDHVKGFGGKVAMTSSDWPTGSDRIVEVLRTKQQLDSAQIVVNVQGDEPCVDPEVFTKIVKLLAQDTQAVVSTAAVKITTAEDYFSRSVVKCVLDMHGNALYFSRAPIPGSKEGQFQPDLPIYRHVGIYAYRREFLMRYAELPLTPLQQIESLEQLKVLEHGYRIKVAIVQDQSIGVDVPEDIQKVELLLCKQSSFSSQAASAPR